MRRPTGVKTPPNETVHESKGFVEPSFEQGALLLKNAEGRVYRLSWNEDSNEATQAAETPDRDRRRALPAGKYHLIGYRLCKVDENDVRWDLSASHPKLRTLEIEAGATRRVEISEAITIRHKLSAASLRVTITGEGPAGLTIYKAGRRIPIEFELKDTEGETRHSGKLRYG